MKPWQSFTWQRKISIFDFSFKKRLYSLEKNLSSSEIHSVAYNFQTWTMKPITIENTLNMKLPWSKNLLNIYVNHTEFGTKWLPSSRKNLEIYFFALIFYWNLIPMGHAAIDNTLSLVQVMACFLVWQETITYTKNDQDEYIDGIEQRRRNSIANALELRLSCTNPSICSLRPRCVKVLLCYLLVLACSFTIDLWWGWRTQCGLIKPYGSTDVGQHWFMYGLVASWHQHQA